MSLSRNSSGIFYLGKLTLMNKTEQSSEVEVVGSVQMPRYEVMNKSLKGKDSLKLIGAAGFFAVAYAFMLSSMIPYLETNLQFYSVSDSGVVRADSAMQEEYFGTGSKVAGASVVEPELSATATPFVSNRNDANGQDIGKARRAFFAKYKLTGKTPTSVYVVNDSKQVVTVEGTIDLSVNTNALPGDYLVLGGGLKEIYRPSTNTFVGSVK